MRARRLLVLLALRSVVVPFVAGSQPKPSFRVTFPIARFTRVDVPDSKPLDSMPEKKKPSPRVEYLSKARERITMALLKRLKDSAGEVMHALGRGHSESVYHKALITLLNSKRIPHRSEVICPIMFMGECVGVGRADLIVDDIVVEIKAFASSPRGVSPQLRKYLTSMGQTDNTRNFYGLIINFNTNSGRVDTHEEVQHAKVVRTPPVSTSALFSLPSPVPSRTDFEEQEVHVKTERASPPPVESTETSPPVEYPEADEEDVVLMRVESPKPEVIDLDSVIEPLRFRPYQRTDGRPWRLPRQPDYLRVPSRNVHKY